jgi:hypothetical protein
VAASFGSECEEALDYPNVDPIHVWWLSQLMQTKALLVDRAGLCYSKIVQSITKQKCSTLGGTP